MADLADDNGGLWEALVLAGLSPRTVKLYMRTIWSALEWFDDRGWDLGRAEVYQVVAYIDTKPKTYSSRGLVRCALLHYWSFTSHPSPPGRAIKLPPAPKMVCKALEEDEARILAKAARERRDPKGFAVALGLYQGLRREEIATLPWSAFSDDGWLTVTGKGDRTRSAPVHDVIVGLAEDMPRQGPWVFPGIRGRPAHPMTIWNWVREVAAEAGVPNVRPHVLRHTALATANDNTGDLRAVQELAGHAKPETTAGYTRATSARLRRVVRSIHY